jgi:hypothetical protein
MAYENLPAVHGYKIESNLEVAETNNNPIVCVIGTAAKGETDTYYVVDSPSEAALAYGKDDGTLVRGMYEAIASGAENLRLVRIGATAATLTFGNGVTLTTVEKDDNAGLNYSVYWDDVGGRLRVWRTSDDLLVYDNYPTYPSGAVDENEVSVSGTSTAGDGDLGTLAVPVTLVDAHGDSSAVYTAGTDGVLLSRPKLWEELFKIYRLLENQDMDIVVPMNTYLDDENTDDKTTAEVTTFNASAPWAADANTYPTVGTTYDGLGEVFAQQYLGEWYFWWDMDRDGEAELWPSGVGSATKSTDTAGTALTVADFHPVNFGYQLANFCYTQSQENQEMTGVIGVKPPNSWSLSDVYAWIGGEPTAAASSAGDMTISANGTGLLGNRWMAGRLGSASTGLPGHIVKGVDGLLYGGFIATDDGWLDGTHQQDRNDEYIDIGKYISVVGAIAILANSTNSTAYAASGAPIYGGFYSTLPPDVAPTNSVIPGVRLPFRIKPSTLDTLAGYRYVMYQQKSKGIVVADAPTAARPDSDYQRLSTMRIVKAVLDGIRNVADPYLGKGLSGARRASLETAIDQILARFKKLGYLTRSDFVLKQTATQIVQGKADLELVLVPAFELRQLNVYVALAAQ